MPDAAEQIRAEMDAALRADYGGWDPAANDGSAQHVPVLLQIESVVTRARACGIPAERVLIMLKDAWSVLSLTAHIRSDVRNAELNRLVTASIKAYFREWPVSS
jgi:hypothetical protein